MGTGPCRRILITFVGPFRSAPFLLDVSVKNIWILKRVLCIWLLIRFAVCWVNKLGLPLPQLPLKGCVWMWQKAQGEERGSHRQWQCCWALMPSHKGQVHSGWGWSLPMAQGHKWLSSCQGPPSPSHLLCTRRQCQNELWGAFVPHQGPCKNISCPSSALIAWFPCLYRMVQAFLPAVAVWLDHPPTCPSYFILGTLCLLTCQFSHLMPFPSVSIMLSCGSWAGLRTGAPLCSLQGLFVGRGRRWHGITCVAAAPFLCSKLLCQFTMHVVTYSALIWCHFASVRRWLFVAGL
jgi:hypothetical protein